MIVNSKYLNDYDSIISWQYKGILVTNNNTQNTIMNNCSNVH